MCGSSAGHDNAEMQHTQLFVNMLLCLPRRSCRKRATPATTRTATASRPGSSPWRSSPSAQEVRCLDSAPGTRVEHTQLLVSNRAPQPSHVCYAGAGGWRTLDEWKVMFKKAGFSLEKCEAVGASMHLMVWDQI